MGALIIVLANEPWPVRCLVVRKRCSVPPFTLLKVKRINSFSLKGGTGTDLPLHKLLGTSVRVHPDIIPKQYEKQIFNKIRGWWQRVYPSDFEHITDSFSFEVICGCYMKLFIYQYSDNARLYIHENFFSFQKCCKPITTASPRSVI